MLCPTPFSKRKEEKLLQLSVRYEQEVKQKLLKSPDLNLYDF
jgi:hypothetical protein